MVYITDYTLDNLIKEDVPFIDLTTEVLDIGGQKGRIVFECREDAVICGTEEVQRILTKFNVSTLHRIPSGSVVAPQTEVLAGAGDTADLHMAWKVCQNILEFTSGIATRTARILARAREVNPVVQLVSTRKVIPGTKELATKAVVAGGGLPHRLGISETVLVFEQHTNFLGGLEGVLSKVEALKLKVPEKKIIVEVKTSGDGLRAVQAGVDGVQFDKLTGDLLTEVIREARKINPGVVLLAAGGINEANVECVARTGVDAIVTSAMYHGRPVDFGVRIEAL